MTPLQSVEHELQRQARALRRLARDLVGPTHADDLVQETALRALRSPPDRPHGLGGWLMTVMRRLAHNHRRDELRRRRRERAAGCAAAGNAGLGDDVAHRETLRRTTTALFALPEPYQTTLLQRYFEGRSPTAIARRDGVPVATVKSRLQRGLMLLRTTLDERGARDWRKALLFATGWSGAATALTCSPATWTLLMAKTGKIAACAGLLASALGLYLWQRHDGAEPPPLPRTTAAAADPAAAARGDGEQAIAAEREVVAAGPVAVPDVTHPFAYTLRCRLIDADGLPVRGAQLAFGPPRCALNDWPERTGADGVVTLRWRARLAEQRIALTVRGRHRTGIVRDVELAAGAEHEVVMLAQPRRDTYVLRGRRQGGGVFTLESVTAEDLTVQLLNRMKGGGAAIVARPGLHPDASFGDRLLAAPAAVARHAPPASPEPRALTINFEGAAPVGLQFTTYGSAVAAADGGGALTGTLYGEDGKPVAGSTVVWSREPDRPVGRTRSDDDGRFRFESVPEGPVELRAGGGADGLARTLVHVAADGVTSAALHLRREATIRGTAVDPDGAPLTGHRVLYRSHAHRWVDLAEITEDGTFVLANLPAGTGELLLLTAEDGVPVARIASVLPDSGEVRFDLAALGAPGGSLALRLALPEGLDVAVAEARVWQQDSGCAAAMAPDDDGRLVLDGLPAGFYRVEVGSTAAGWTDLGSHYVDGDAQLDLGTVRLGAWGTVRLPAPLGKRQLELYLRRADGDLRAEHGFGDATRARVPVGDWLLFWRDGDGPVQASEFTLRAGQELELPLPPAPSTR